MLHSHWPCGGHHLQEDVKRYGKRTHKTLEYHGASIYTDGTNRETALLVGDERGEAGRVPFKEHEDEEVQEEASDGDGAFEATVVGSPHPPSTDMAVCGGGGDGSGGRRSGGSGGGSGDGSHVSVRRVRCVRRASCVVRRASVCLRVQVWGVRSIVCSSPKQWISPTKMDLHAGALQDINKKQKPLFKLSLQQELESILGPDPKVRDVCLSFTHAYAHTRSIFVCVCVCVCACVSVYLLPSCPSSLSLSL